MGEARLYELIFLVNTLVAAIASAVVIAVIFYLCPKRFRNGWILTLGGVAAYFAAGAILVFVDERFVTLSLAGFTNGIMLTIPTFILLAALALWWMRGRPMVRRLALPLALLALGYGLARLDAPAAEGRKGLHDLFVGTMLVRQIKQDPATGLVWEAWRRDVPEETEAMIGRALALIDRAPEGNAGFQNTFTAFRSDVMRLRPGYYADIVRAPDAALNQLGRATLRSYSDIQADPQECAAMMGGRALTPDYAAQPASPRLDMAVARLVAAALDAVAAGRRTPVMRDVSEPVAIERNIEARIDIPAALRARAGSPARVAALSAADQCTLGLAHMRAILSLPAPSVARLMAFRYARVAAAAQHPQP